MRAITAFTVVLVFALAGTALAANPHFIGDVSFTDQGTTLAASGSIAGLGNEDTVIFITATGVPTVTCTNPSGSNQPPGQNPGEITVSGGEEVPEGSIVNGRLNFDIATAEPRDPTAAEAGCPNRKWDAQITDVDFSSATISFYQGDGCALTSQGVPNNRCSLVFSELFTL